MSWGLSEERHPAEGPGRGGGARRALRAAAVVTPGRPRAARPRRRWPRASLLVSGPWAQLPGAQPRRPGNTATGEPASGELSYKHFHLQTDACDLSPFLNAPGALAAAVAEADRPDGAAAAPGLGLRGERLLG